MAHMFITVVKGVLLLSNIFSNIAKSVKQVGESLYLEKFVLNGQEIKIRDAEAKHSGDTGLTIEEVVNTLYPVGATMIRMDGNDPNGFIGVGTWTKMSDGYALVTGTPGNNLVADDLVLGVNNIPSHTHTVQSAGSHNHTISVENAGAHTHSVSVASSGAHTHSGTANSAGAHEHTLTLKWSSGRGASGTNIGQVNTGGTETSTGAWGTAESAGAHTHSVSVPSGGAHTHSGTAASAGGHNHSASSANNGAHTHTLSNTGSGEGIEIGVNNIPRITIAIWRRIA